MLAAARLEHRADADVVQQLGDALRLALAAASAAAPATTRAPGRLAATGGGAFGAGRVDAIFANERRHHRLRHHDRALEPVAHLVERVGRTVRR